MTLSVKNSVFNSLTPKMNHKFRIDHIDGLRGIAIIAVIYFHAYYRWQEVEPFAQLTSIQAIASFGWLGVQLFFCISGYVIYLSLRKSPGFLDFAKKRFLRLAPAMYVASFFLFISAYFISERPEGAVKFFDMLPGLLFIEPYYLSKLSLLDVQSLDGAFWSLYIEVKFYLVAAVLFFVLNDKALRVLFYAYSFYFSVTVLHVLELSYWVIDKISNVLYHLGFEHYGWFLIGILAFKVFEENSRKDTGLLLGIALATICQTLMKNNIYSLSQIIALCTTVALFLTPFISNNVQRVLSNRFLLFVGFISYPLYLIHQNTVTGLAIKLYETGVVLPSYLYPLPFILLCMALAYLIAKSEPYIRQMMAKLVS